jgi:tight adherence protein C
MRLDAGLPLMLDLLVLGLESGQGLTGAWQLACRHCPRGPLARSIEQVLAAWQAGQGRAQALIDWAQRERTASIRQLVSLLNQSDRLGASLAPLLRRQAEELRLRQQLEAETRALELPVRLLAPLLICILPCTFLVLLFPIVQQLRQAL